MQITDFLLARIAEDEHHAKQAWAFGSRGSRWLSEPERQLAECEAKRRIVDGALHDNLDTSHGLMEAVYLLASVYSDHPDYDWQD